MVSSTSDNDIEVTSLPPVESGLPPEEAIKSRLLLQGAGSRLDSDLVRGKIPVFNEDVPGLQVGVINTAYSSSGAVSTGTTVIPVDDTIPQNTEGDEKLTVSITPTSATNILYIEAVINAATSAGGNFISAALFQDSTAGALSASTMNVAGTDSTQPLVLRHKMTAGTTSATTFKVRVGPGGAQTVTVNGFGGVRLFGGVCLSSIRVLEVTP